MPGKKTTTIEWNGSRSAGARPASIETLFECLEKYRLCDALAPYMSNITWKRGWVRLFGNFDEYSHAYSLDTCDPDLIARYVAAVRLNRRDLHALGIL